MTTMVRRTFDAVMSRFCQMFNLVEFQEKLTLFFSCRKNECFYLSITDVLTMKTGPLLDGFVDPVVEEDEEDGGQNVDHDGHLEHVDAGVHRGNSNQKIRREYSF